MRKLWTSLTTHQSGTEEHKLLHKRLYDVTAKIKQDVAAYKTRRDAILAQQSGGTGQVQGTNYSQSQHPQQQRPQSQAGQLKHQQVLSNGVMQHVQTFDYSLPPEISPNTSEADKALNSLKSSYLNSLTKQEHAAAQLKQIKAIMDQRRSQGLDLQPEIMTKKAQAETTYNQMKNFVDEFRKKQASWKIHHERRTQQQHSNNDAPTKNEGSAQIGNPHVLDQSEKLGQQVVKEAYKGSHSDGTVNIGTESIREQSNPNHSLGSTSMAGESHQIQHHMPYQQQGQQQQQAQTIQQPAKIQQQRLQQNSGQGNHLQADQPQNVNSGRLSSQQAHEQHQRPQQQQQNLPNLPQQRDIALGHQAQYVNGQAQSPSNIPTSATSLPGHLPLMGAQHQQSHIANSSGSHIGSNLNSNGGAASTGPPALSQSAALSAVAQTYSDSRGGPNTSGGGANYLQLDNREQNTNTKMPITKTLNVSTPQPVSLGPARPTMAGPTNGGPVGVMGQPAIPKAPGFVLEGDGDRVLSKKKLDELVRQVTGRGNRGIVGDLAEGEGVTPEVEDVSLVILSNHIYGVCCYFWLSLVSYPFFTVSYIWYLTILASGRLLLFLDTHYL